MSFTEMRKIGGYHQHSSLGHIAFEMPVRHPSGYVK